MLTVFTALREMQTRSNDENSVCLSVCPSVCHTRDPDKMEERWVQIFKLIRLKPDVLKRKKAYTPRPVGPEQGRFPEDTAIALGHLVVHTTGKVKAQSVNSA